MPTCFGPGRRVVLDQLENRYKRRFCNHWSFVRYAEETGLNLDFTTSPKRPGRTVRAIDKLAASSVPVANYYHVLNHWR